MLTLQHEYRPLSRAMQFSLWIGFLMLAIKLLAFLLTDSTAILSDAAESVVHVVAVSFAAYSLHLSARPADAQHLYGYAKANFFSAGFEGAMIIIAAIYIIYEAVFKWMTGLHLQNLGIGTLLTLLAVLINGALGWYLVRTGKRNNSILIEANGTHVLTDCWTSIGVILGLILTNFTGWLPWDPIFAIIVALNILVSGFLLIRRSVSGLLDVADPEIHEMLLNILDKETKRHGIRFHNLLHRDIGNIHFVEFHLLFKEDVSIRNAHGLATRIEDMVENALGGAVHINTHLECIEDHGLIHNDGDHELEFDKPSE